MQEKLSQFHVTILIFMTQAGLAVFSLSQVLATHFGTNGWIALLPTAAIVTLNIWLIIIVYRLGKGKSIFEIMERSIPKFLLYPLYVLLVAVWSLLGCFVGMKYVIVFQMIAFPTTNPLIFKFVFDVLAFMLLIKGIYNISKAASVFYWATAWMTLLLFYFFSDFNWARLTPYVFRESTITWQSFPDIFFAFLGFELSLLLFPYINKKTKFSVSVVSANFYVLLVYLFLSIVTFGFYGHRYLKELQFPLLSMFAYIQFPFIQGTEILLYSFFIFTIIVTSVMYFWSAKEVCKQVIPINGSWLAAGILLFAFCVSFSRNVLTDIEQWLKFICYMELGVSFGLPLFLILILLIQKMRGGKNA